MLSDWLILQHFQRLANLSTAVFQIHDDQIQSGPLLKPVNPRQLFDSDKSILGQNILNQAQLIL